MISLPPARLAQRRASSCPAHPLPSPQLRLQALRRPLRQPLRLLVLVQVAQHRGQVAGAGQRVAVPWALRGLAGPQLVLEQ